MIELQGTAIMNRCTLLGMGTKGPFQFTGMFWSINLLSLAADRKSTRLNSSHANISYAVFCLKKKNINLNICDTSFVVVIHIVLNCRSDLHRPFLSTHPTIVYGVLHYTNINSAHRKISCLPD